ncbi:hypothetical protein [Burkholderia sp. L27(2015)]|uniref:hypothetical protein n=1 Tax=Burkholderia sp. L27(2015) TaxID=1641858 RepID=UPI00131D5BE2|nr:hypothetical protein [Burkholderia sp. L27(2015)]
MNELKTFTYFHDWYIDILAVTDDGDSLTLGLKLADRRATVTFVGTTRCVIEHYGLLNIVYDIKILEPGTPRYEHALKTLDSSDRFSDKQPKHLALVAATVGAEMVVEFTSLRIESV